MKFNSALGLLASGVALFLLHISMPGSRALRLARLLAMFVAAVGGLTLLEHMFGIDLGIDAISSYPGRMAPATALSFLFVGLALLTLKASKDLPPAPICWRFRRCSSRRSPSSATPMA